jgi:hypothetical protein
MSGLFALVWHDRRCEARAQKESDPRRLGRGFSIAKGRTLCVNHLIHSKLPRHSTRQPRIHDVARAPWLPHISLVKYLSTGICGMWRRAKQADFKVGEVPCACRFALRLLDGLVARCIHCSPGMRWIDSRQASNHPSAQLFVPQAPNTIATSGICPPDTIRHRVKGMALSAARLMVPQSVAAARLDFTATGGHQFGRQHHLRIVAGALFRTTLSMFDHLRRQKAMSAATGQYQESPFIRRGGFSLGIS